MKIIRILSFFGPYYSVFVLNMKIHLVNLRIREYTDQKNSENVQFSYSLYSFNCFFYILVLLWLLLLVLLLIL